MYYHDFINHCLDLFQKSICHGRPREEMLARGNMEEIVAEENMEEVGLDNSEEVEVEEDESESEEKVDFEGHEEEGSEVIAKKKKITSAIWFATKKFT